MHGYCKNNPSICLQRHARSTTIMYYWVEYPSLYTYSICFVGMKGDLGPAFESCCILQCTQICPCCIKRMYHDTWTPAPNLGLNLPAPLHSLGDTQFVLYDAVRSKHVWLWDIFITKQCPAQCRQTFLLVSKCTRIDAQSLSGQAAWPAYEEIWLSLFAIKTSLSLMYYSICNCMIDKSWVALTQPQPNIFYSHVMLSSLTSSIYKML